MTMALNMRLSDRGMAFLMRFEGFSPCSYRDEANHYTIGYGHRIQRLESFDELTPEQAEAMLLHDVAQVENAVGG